MPKSSQQSPEEMLDGLRAQLEMAEHAASDLPEDADDETRAAAQEHLAQAQAALAQAHLDAQAREEAKAQEIRDLEVLADAETKEYPHISFQEFVQAGTTQNVRGTDALTPEEHAARRNPQHS
jgi:hypothetical protein